MVDNVVVLLRILWLRDNVSVFLIGCLIVTHVGRSYSPVLSLLDRRPLVKHIVELVAQLKEVHEAGRAEAFEDFKVSVFGARVLHEYMNTAAETCAPDNFWPFFFVG